MCDVLYDAPHMCPHIVESELSKIYIKNCIVKNNFKLDVIIFYEQNNYKQFFLYIHHPLYYNDVQM